MATAMSGVSVVVLGLGLRASHQQQGATLSAQPAGVVQGPAPTTAAAGSAASPSPLPATTSAVAAAQTINGTSEETRYGPVQVQITVSAGRITKATAIDYPQGSGRDQEINRVAIPQLDAEVVQAQSAHLDAVSGATYTSEGYVGSLQAALDAAHLP